jgi:uncharacterized protein
MIGIFIELAISWALLWYFFKENLFVLGIKPNKSRLIDFILGFSVSMFICSILLLILGFFAKTVWLKNPNHTFLDFFKGSWWVLKSVLTEELLFRGALLYLAYKKWGIKNSILLSAICFGVYHWFSYNVFGNISSMISVFIITAIGGWMFAYSFVKTKSLYLPIGLHLGWNLANIIIFSQGPLGKQLFIYMGGQQIGMIDSTLIFIAQLALLPLLTYWYLRKRKN